MFKIFSLHISPWKVLLLLGDALCYALSVMIALYLYPHTAVAPWRYLGEHWLAFLCIGAIYFVVLFIGDLYNYLKDYRQIMNLVHVLIFSWIGTIAMVVTFYFPSKGSYIGRSLMIIQAVSFSVLVASWRFAFSAVALPQRMEKRIFIVGAGKSGRYLLNAIRERPGCGFLPVGFVDDDPQKIGTMVDGLLVLGDSSQLSVLIQEHNIPMVVAAITRERSARLTESLIKVSWINCQLIDMPTIYEFLTGKLPTEHISDNWIFEWNINSSRIYYLRLKRFIDLTLAVIFLVLTSPLILFTALLIKLEGSGPLFFFQERFGQNGKVFKIIKFRTMIEGAENCGPRWTANHDPRITKVGRFIRKLRLDELPQLINILKGEMSFIGPRPLAHYSSMEDIPYYNYRILVKPGITGWAQVMFPDGLTVDTTTEKVKYDLYYIKNIGFLLDLAILLKTIRIVALGRAW
jgi:exopolysaccharide biosynthesis polyprenyl glycosylphosphotransferase